MHVHFASRTAAIRSQPGQSSRPFLPSFRGHLEQVGNSSIYPLLEHSRLGRLACWTHAHDRVESTAYDHYANHLSGSSAGPVQRSKSFPRYVKAISNISLTMYVCNGIGLETTLLFMLISFLTSKPPSFVGSKRRPSGICTAVRPRDMTSSCHTHVVSSALRSGCRPVGRSGKRPVTPATNCRRRRASV